MAIRDFAVRISGQVGYRDGTKDSFEASGVWKGHLGGQVATHNEAHSKESFAVLDLDESDNIQALLALLPGSHSYTPATPVGNKGIRNFVIEISGHAAHTDNTSGGFVVQWVDGLVDVFPSATDTNYQAILDDPEALAFLSSVYQKVVDSITIS